MGQWFPELPEHRARIRDVLRAEEERFTETLARGMKLFEEVAARGAIDGKDAFDLTATYGFPFELTRGSRSSARSRSTRTASGSGWRSTGRSPGWRYADGRRPRRGAVAVRRLRAD